MAADQRELVFRRGFGEEIVHARFGGDRGGGQAVVAGDHHGADAHAAQFGEALPDAALDDVLQLDHAEHARAFGHHQRRAAARAMASTRARTSVRHAAASAARHSSRSRRPRPCGYARVARHRRRSCACCAENGTNCTVVQLALRAGRICLGQHHDAAAFRRFVGQRRQLRRFRQLPVRSRPAPGWNAAAWRLPSVMVPVLSSSSTSTSPAASTARPEVAITLACIMRLMPAMPMADSSAPMVVGIRHTSSATSTVTGTARAARGLHAVKRERQQRHARPPGTRSSAPPAGWSARSRWASSARLAPSTIAIMRSRKASPGLRGDAHHDPVRQHPRAAGDRGAVAAGFADHRRRFAGDGALVHRGHAFDHFAVGGNGVAGLDQHDVALGSSSLGIGTPRVRIVPRFAAASWRTTRFLAAQRRGLRLAAALGQRLGEVGEQHGEPQPHRDGEVKPGGASPWPRERLRCPAASSGCCRRRRRTSPDCATARAAQALIEFGAAPASSSDGIEHGQRPGGIEVFMRGSAHCAWKSCKCSTTGPSASAGT